MDFKKIISEIAPTLGTALLGPFGGMAVSAITGILGIDNTESSLKHVMKCASPDTILKIKQAEIEFAKHVKEMDIDLERINAADRDSARQMQMSTNSNTPEILAFFVTVSYVGIVFYVLKYGFPENGADVLKILLGSFGTAWTGIIAFYFGSSRGSKEKTKHMANKGL